MVAWFKQLLVSQQILVLLLAAGTVAIVVDATNDPPVGGRDTAPIFGTDAGTVVGMDPAVQPPASVASGDRDVSTFSGLWHGSFRLARLVTAEGEWEPFLVFSLTVDADGRVSVVGSASQIETGTWGFGRVTASFSCSAMLDSAHGFECPGRIHVETVWQFTGVGRHPLLGTVWSPGMIAQDHSFSQTVDEDATLVITLTEDLRITGVVTGALTRGLSEPAIEGQWFGPLGVEDPLRH